MAMRFSVREHGQLGDAGRAGGRAKQRNVGGLYCSESPAEFVRRSLVHPLPQRFDLLEGHETGRLVPIHPARIVVHEVLEAGQPVTHLQHLVDLFLVLGDHDADLGGFQHAGEFVRDGVLVEAQGEDVGRLGGQLGDHPLGPVVPDDRDAVPRFGAQLRQPQREGAHPPEVFRPGDLLPDPELLFAQRDFVGAVGGSPGQQAGEGVGRMWDGHAQP